MESDYYPVEVLHYLNPHLIWVEVIKSPTEASTAYQFEQIGVWGVLPLESTIDMVDECLKTRKADVWAPAVKSIMAQILQEVDEVWFCPTFIDRRSSIFDSNIHKYGELILKTKDGSTKKLSQILVKTNQAYYNECDFHREMSQFNLNTKLNTSQTQQVITALEDYYKSDKNYKSYELSIKNSAVIHCAARNFETELTEKNIQLHNKAQGEIDIKSILLQKHYDFNLCKDADEESVDCDQMPHSPQDVSHDTPAAKSTPTKEFLLRKLTLAKKISNKSVLSSDSTNILLATKKKLLENAVIKMGHSSDINSSIDLTDNRVEAKFCGGIHTQQLRGNTVADTTNQFTACDSEYGENYTIKKRKGKVSNSPKRQVPVYDTATQKLIAFGPPEVDKSKLSLKVIEKHFTGSFEDYNDKKLKPMPDDEIMNMDNDLKGMDSEVNFPIGNSTCNIAEANVIGETTVLNDDIINIPKIESPLSDKDAIKSTSLDKNKTVEHKPVIKAAKISPLSDTDSAKSITSNRASHSTPKSKLNSSIAKKVSLYKKATASSSDTSAKDASSSSVEDTSSVRNNNDKINDDSDDETTISVLVKRLNLDGPKAETKSKDSPKRTNQAALDKHHVNPFKNIDKSIAKFVDKLVSPVLMVHSRLDMRIQPIYDLRDMCFSTDIHVVLRNMLVKHPKTLQTISWPTILRGLSLIMVSPPGGGKTLGYVPAVCRLVADFDAGNIRDSAGPICVIVCATSASLALVAKHCRSFLGRGKTVLACYPGVDEQEFMLTLLNGCDIFVSTPSCLVRLLKIQDFGLDLRRLSVCVLDDCERLNEVYVNEIKYFLQMIKEMLKNRVNKLWKVQYIAASRIWCDIVEGVAKKTHNSVISIGSFQECVLYSKSNMSIIFVKSENKLNAVLDFIDNVDLTKRTVIICRSDDEVNLVSEILKCNRLVVISANATMTVEDLYTLNCTWSDYGDPLMGPILVCCDDNVTHLNITDAHNLLHYSLPSLYSMFTRRFAVLVDHYPSIYNDNNENVRIKMFLDEKNVQQLPKIMNFIKRCSDNVPTSLEDICSKVLTDKDRSKAQSLVPICDNVLGLGECPDFWNCISRHTLFKEYDEPPSWVPVSGVVEFRILHYHTAVTYSARLIANVVNGQRNKYPQTYSTLPLKMGMFFSVPSKRQLHGIPKLGDLCAVSVRPNFYERGQVVKILSRYETNGNPNYVLVKLIDEEKLERCRDVELYHLPEQFRNVNCNVVQVRLANVQPKDKDITYSDLARDCLSKLTQRHEDMYIRAKIVVAIGNVLLVDSLEACQDLSSMRQTVVLYNLKEELLKCHAIVNPEHIGKIKAICERDGLVKSSTDVAITETCVVVEKELPKPRWAHLDEGDILVYFASAESPDKFFVRLEKYENCLNLLTKDIQKYMSETQPTPLSKLVSNAIVIAKFPDDSLYYRARIDERLDQNKAKCFFVDHGDWRDVYINDLYEIEAKFITPLPFQAIECRLVGLKPPGAVWTEFSTNWLCDQCFVGASNDLKEIYARYFTKEIAESTEGNKYGIVLIDTDTNDDIVINNQMLANNLACEHDEEISYLRDLVFKRIEKESTDSEDESIVERESSEPKEVIETETTVSLSDVFMKKPIRSMPLVNSDDEPDDWDIQMSQDMLNSIVKIGNAPSNPDTKVTVAKNVPAIKPKQESRSNDERSNTSSKLSDFVVIPTPRIQDLDSDDLSSPERTQSDSDASQMEMIELRKPKLYWHQKHGHVTIKIELIGVDKYTMDIKERSIEFDTLVHDRRYGFKMDLYGVVDPEKSTHVSKGLYIYVKLAKVLAKKWMSLARDEVVRKWIAYDPDSLDASSDEDDANETKEEALKIIKAAHEAADSDSGDDGEYMIDDFR